MEFEETNDQGNLVTVASCPPPEGLSRYASDSTILTFDTHQSESDVLETQEANKLETPQHFEQWSPGLSQMKRPILGADNEVVNRGIFDEKPPVSAKLAPDELILTQMQQHGQQILAVSSNHRPAHEDAYSCRQLNDGNGWAFTGGLVYSDSNTVESIEQKASSPRSLLPCRMNACEYCGNFFSDCICLRRPELRYQAYKLYLHSEKIKNHRPLAVNMMTRFASDNRSTHHNHQQVLRPGNHQLLIPQQNPRCGMTAPHIKETFQLTQELGSATSQRSALTTTDFFSKFPGVSLQSEVEPSNSHFDTSEMVLSSPVATPKTDMCSLIQTQQTGMNSSVMHQADRSSREGMIELSSLTPVMDWDVTLGYTREGTTGLRAWREIRGARRRVEDLEIRLLILLHKQEISRRFAGSIHGGVNPEPMFLKRSKDISCATHVWTRTGSFGKVRQSFWEWANFKDIRKDINTKRSSKSRF